MTDKNKIIELIKKKIVVLDGATGTELQKKGMPAGVCPEIWVTENREIQKSIYKSYCDAGSDIIYTCTFGANYYKLSQYGRDDVEKINAIHAEMAKEAAGNAVITAGDIGPSGHFIEPFGEIKFADAIKMFKRQVKGLLDGGCDIFVIETQMDIQEARAALIAVKEITDAFTIVTMTYEPDGRTLNGTTPEAALITLQSLGADAVGCNCSTGPAEMVEFIKRLKPIAKIPLAAKPNAGLPKIVNSKTVFPMEPKEFSSFAKSFADAGVNLIGGCCGTTPDHIKLLAENLKGVVPKPPVCSSVITLSSATEALIIDKTSAAQIIGERINPTGKKKLQAEFAGGKLELAQTMAAEQEAAGANLLDINTGMPGIDEKEIMLAIIKMLAPSCKLPFVIDSSSPDVVEAALRLYPGRALLNSISGEKTKTEKLLPVAAKYGAMFILLPVADNEVPETWEKRAEVAETVFKKAEKFGFSKSDVVVDGLVMAASSNPNAAMQTLKTIEWAFKNNFASVTGLSNISFGLPARKKINSSFLSMAISNGLTFVIANPLEKEIMWAKHTSDILCSRDENGSAYIKFTQENPDETAALKSSIQSSDLSSHNAMPDNTASNGRIFDAIVKGMKGAVAAFVKSELESGKKPADILEKEMIPAILHTGALFDAKKYFLPQLIASAETMKNSFAILEPLLEDRAARIKGKILFATVEGDIHDIGKNIVILLLRNYGFDVKDLGKSIPAKDIIAAAKEFQPDIIALSALMTTTMIKIPEVLALAKKEKIAAKFMAGGAVVTKEWAESIGASYSKDGLQAVRVAEQLAASRCARIDNV